MRSIHVASYVPCLPGNAQTRWSWLVVEWNLVIGRLPRVLRATEAAFSDTIPRLEDTFLHDQVRLNMLFGFQRTWIALQAAFKQEDGQDLVEYALVVFIVSTAAVGALGGVAASLVDLIRRIGAALP
jgi:Flp pilus assembly pilin Flp